MTFRTLAAFEREQLHELADIGGARLLTSLSFPQTLPHGPGSRESRPTKAPPNSLRLFAGPDQVEDFAFEWQSSIRLQSPFRTGFS